MGIRGSLAVSMVLMGVSLGKDSDRADDTGSMTIRVGMDRGCMDSDSLVDRAVLPSCCCSPRPCCPPCCWPLCPPSCRPCCPPSQHYHRLKITAMLFIFYLLK